MKDSFILFVDKETLLTLRNVSSAMRWKVNQILKERSVFVRYYNQKVLQLNGKVHLTESNIIGSRPTIYIGVANYTVATQADLTRLKSISPEISCCLRAKSKIYSRQAISAVSAEIDSFSNYFGIPFKRVNQLKIKGLTENDAVKLLSNIEKIGSVSFRAMDIGINLSLMLGWVREITLEKVNLTFTIAFPLLNRLHIRGNVDFSKISCEDLTELKLTNTTEISQNWLSSLTKLKKTELVNCSLPSILGYLARSIREISSDDPNFDLTLLNSSNFPCLISLFIPRTTVKLSQLQKTNLRQIQANFQEDSGSKLELRLRKAVITDENSDFFNRNPEIISNCSELAVFSSQFDLDNLPKALKSVEFTEFSKESAVLTRI